MELKKKKTKEDAISTMVAIPVTVKMRERLFSIIRDQNIDLNSMTREFFEIVLERAEKNRRQPLP
jgi:hypothetical protein